MSRGSERSHRHIGQVRCECSHMSMHTTWNRCLHDGISRTISPVCSSSRHIEHGSPFPASRSPPPLSPCATRRVREHWQHVHRGLLEPERVCEPMLSTRYAFEEQLGWSSPYLRKHCLTTFLVNEVSGAMGDYMVTHGRPHVARVLCHLQLLKNEKSKQAENKQPKDYSKRCSVA
ncbi:hypothetical protein OsI_06559 [Oryza sativa Indica Group]|uniref:Uncharacterized protein n=1 Tax=Oryza sativa subsp. indica TaxID=39946 RepID=B8AEY7_ORYSI|nr:hypothetical protein OsI_06559 [Oryza sativa Indica Group]